MILTLKRVSNLRKDIQPGNSTAILTPLPNRWETRGEADGNQRHYDSHRVFAGGFEIPGILYKIKAKTNFKPLRIYDI